MQALHCNANADLDNHMYRNPPHPPSVNDSWRQRVTSLSPLIQKEEQEDSAPSLHSAQQDVCTGLLAENMEIYTHCWHLKTNKHTETISIREASKEEMEKMLWAIFWPRLPMRRRCSSADCCLWLPPLPPHQEADVAILTWNNSRLSFKSCF